MTRSILSLPIQFLFETSGGGREDICFGNFSNRPVICAVSITSSIFTFTLSTAPTFHSVRIFLAWITSCSHTPSRLMQVSAHPYLGVQICSKLCRVCMLYVIPYMCLIFSTHQVVHITGKISGSRNGDRQKYGRQVDSMSYYVC